MKRSIRMAVFAGATAAISLLLLSSASAGETRGDARDRSVQPAPSASGATLGLAGTAWRLVSFQSMDDSVGTVRPDDPTAFTMQLNRDGTAVFRLDCNRARGNWSAEPAADGASGRFAFDGVTSTRAHCPPPHLDELIVGQAGFVRGYLVKDRRLHLSLMADGGIFTWEPIADSMPFANNPDAELEAAILRYTPDYTREVARVGGMQARYLYARIDLNGDGKQEVFAYLLGSYFCGTGGCTLLLFAKDNDEYRLVNTFPISRLPVIVGAERTGGWRELIRPESGGGRPPSYVRHTFDGVRYVPRERLRGDTAPKGTRILVGEFTFQDGIPLKARN